MADSQSRSARDVFDERRHRARGRCAERATVHRRVAGRLCDLDGAIADFNQAIRLDPNYALAYRNRGNAKRKKGDVDGAIADYNRAIKLGPQSADAIIQDLGLFVPQGELGRPEELPRDRSPGKRIWQASIR